MFLFINVVDEILKTFWIYTDHNTEKVNEQEDSGALLKNILILLVHIYYFPKYIDDKVVDGEDKEKKEPS